MSNMNQQTILRMVAEGKITAEEGAQLIEALYEAKETERLAPPIPLTQEMPRRTGKGKFLRVIVKVGDDSAKSEDKVNMDVNLPIQFARKLAPLLETGMPEKAKEKLEKSGITMESIAPLLESLDEDMEGRDLVNIDVSEGMTDGEGAVKVRIYVE
jgi:hypothetical protein